MSEQLGMRFVLDGRDLLMFAVNAGAPLLSDREAAEMESRRAELEKQRADREKQRADEKAAARKALEAELARLRQSPNKSSGQRRKKT